MKSGISVYKIVKRKVTTSVDKVYVDLGYGDINGHVHIPPYIEYNHNVYKFEHIQNWDKIDESKIGEYRRSIDNYDT